MPNGGLTRTDYDRNERDLARAESAIVTLTEERDRLREALRGVVKQLDLNAESNRFNCPDDPDWTGVGEAREIARAALEAENESI